MENIKNYENLEKSPETTMEKLEKIKEAVKLEDSEKSGIPTAEEYVKKGFMKPLGEMTEEGLEELIEINPSGLSLRAELIPLHLRTDGKIYRVYEITEDLEENKCILHQILQEEEKRREIMELKKKQGYDNLAQEGYLKELGMLSQEEITTYKEEHKLLDEMILNVNTKTEDDSDYNENKEQPKQQCYYYEIIT